MVLPRPPHTTDPGSAWSCPVPLTRQTPGPRGPAPPPSHDGHAPLRRVPLDLAQPVEAVLREGPRRDLVERGARVEAVVLRPVLRVRRRAEGAVHALALTDLEQLVAEAPPRDAVQEEVDGVVHVGHLVDDGFGGVVGVTVLPVGASDDEDDGGRDEAEEGEGRAQAHGRHLRVRLLLRRLDLLARVEPARPDERADDGDVAEQDHDEGQHAHEREHDPRTHELLKVAELGSRAAAVGAHPQTHVVVPVLQTPRPQHVQVLTERHEEEPEAVELGPGRFTHLGLGQREADGDEAVDGEDDEDPDCRVAHGVRDELLEFARRGVQLLDDDEVHRLEPLRDDARQQHQDVEHRHQPQVHVRRRPCNVK